MTTPIERAATAILDACYGQELPEAPIDLARAAFKSIDRDALIDVLARTDYDCEIADATDHGMDMSGEPAWEDVDPADRIFRIHDNAWYPQQADAVIAWLTGNDH